MSSGEEASTAFLCPVCRRKIGQNISRLWPICGRGSRAPSGLTRWSLACAVSKPVESCVIHRQSFWVLVLTRDYYFFMVATCRYEDEEYEDMLEEELLQCRQLYLESQETITALRSIRLGGNAPPPPPPPRRSTLVQLARSPQRVRHDAKCPLSSVPWHRTA